ncbi:hypothetical protein [Alteriqipengyuania lutimaris]|uniref:Uncharacterized protein n=1 Tax=Alteriqipengyuania lutimaris TaxID=1538146 RepID=A0A395LIM5_9SPHN|nr:hypothetical protein [Alteriqipengyuania lutimaris]MBB3034290.1 hypothetical protein [Alteriqipengyuania lutimaris]RDS76803.1 hypothetical protein DL238_03710 [Alteriqipengyuania lutimaris]
MRHAIALAIAPMLAIGCADASDASELPSVLPHVETLRPLIACIAERVEQSDETEEWSGGAPRGPAQSSATVAACQAESGVTIRQVSNREPTDFTDPEFAKQGVFFMALMTFGDHRDHLTVEEFDEAMAIARCLQQEQIVKGQILRKSPGEAHEITMSAMDKCVPNHREYLRNPEDMSLLGRSGFLGNTIGRLNLRYVEAASAGEGT